MAFSASSLAHEAASRSHRSLNRSTNVSSQNLSAQSSEKLQSSHDRLASRLRQKNIERQIQAIQDHEDDRQSSASGSSRSGGAGATLLKGLIALKNDMANRRLRWLTYAVALCLLAVSALAVAENLIYQSVYDGVVSQVEKVAKRGNAAERAVSVVEAVRSLQLARSTLGDQPGLWTELEAITKLKEDTTTLKNIVPDLSPTKSTPLPFPVRINTTKTMITLPLLEAINSAVLKITYILSAPSSDSLVPIEMDWLLQNVGTSILGGLNVSSLQPLSEMPHKDARRIGLSSVGPFVFLAVFVGVIWPLYGLIEENRKKFLNVFLDIPKEVVKGIHENHLNRFLALEEELDDEDDSNVDVERHIMKEKLLADNQTPGMIDGLTLDSDRAADDFDDTEDYSPTTGLFKWLFHVRDQHNVIPKAGVVFLLCCAYFFSAGGLTWKFLNGFEGSVESVFWAGQRGVFVRGVEVVGREVLLSSGSTPIAETSFPVGNLESLIEGLQFIQRGLVYGSEEMKTPSTLASGDVKHVELLLRNACVEGSPEDCGTFNNGILSHGLQTALEFYISTAQPLTSTTDPIPPSTISLLRTLSQTYFPATLQKSIDLYTSPITEKATWFKNYHLTFTVIFILLLSASYLFLFRPLVRGMAEDIRRTHVMLFMIPPEVLSKVGLIKEWMAEKKGKGKKKRKDGGGGTEVTKEEVKDKEKGSGKKVEIMVSAAEMV
ncbi:hypothetical protein HK097_003920 [Rhizophlyctis rosea]|uniref:Uncharacterized protein n=1 Tax=Rhizophlyctis rosea TaxID=64517 RepID=A0AAD5S1U0_9FUNG|nr:hypothetical protein HK097_003920 [Rhizophlyctis rosea]